MSFQDIAVSPHGHLFALIDNAVYQRVADEAYHLPQSMRGVKWQRVASQEGLSGIVVKLVAAGNGVVYALTDEGRVFQYGRDNTQFTGLHYKWEEVACLSDTAAPVPPPVAVAEPPKPRLIGKFKAAEGPHRVHASAGAYVVVTGIPTFTVERQDGRSWLPIHMDSTYRFVLPEDRVLRIGAREAGDIELIREHD